MALDGIYVKVNEVQIVGRDVFEKLKNTIEDKAKSYCALVWC